MVQCTRGLRVGLALQYATPRVSPAPCCIHSVTICISVLHFQLEMYATIYLLMDTAMVYRDRSPCRVRAHASHAPTQLQTLCYKFATSYCIQVLKCMQYTWCDVEDDLPGVPPCPRSHTRGIIRDVAYNLLQFANCSYDVLRHGVQLGWCVCLRDGFGSTHAHARVVADIWATFCKCRFQFVAKCMQLDGVVSRVITSTSTDRSCTPLYCTLHIAVAMRIA